MADLPSVGLKMNDSEVSPDAPIAESFEAKVGSNINYLLDENDDRVSEIATINAALLTKATVTHILTITGVPNPCKTELVLGRSTGAGQQAYLLVTSAPGGVPTGAATAHALGSHVLPIIWKIVDGGGGTSNIEVYTMSTP